MEKWRDINGFEGIYQVSNLGKIRSLNYNNTGAVCIKKQVKNKRGKMEINLWKGNKAYPKTVARVVYETFTGRKLRVNYLIQYVDNNPENCSFANLYIKSKIRKPNPKNHIRTFKNETWKDIPNYEGLYEISSFGRVKCLNYRQTKKPQILKPKKSGYNTLSVKLVKNGKAKDLGLAKLVYKTFLGIDVDRKNVIKYKDGNPCNCAINNLYVITMSEELLNEYENDRRFRAKFDYYGEDITVRDIEKITGIPISTAWSRLNTQKWNIYETVETPIAINNSHKKRKEKIVNGYA